MGLVDRIERKLESTVGDAFARVFGGSIVPQEVEAMLHKEAGAGVRELAGGRILAPNDYVITLSVPDYHKVSADPDLTSTTFAKHLEGYIHEQGWQTYGDVVVRFEQSANLHTGQFRARGAVNPDSATGEPAPALRDRAFTAEPGVPPMTDNPSNRGGQGQGRPDEYYDDRYGRPEDREGGQEPRGQYPPDQEPRSQEPRSQEPRGQEPRGQEPRSQEPRGQYPPARNPAARNPAANIDPTSAATRRRKATPATASARVIPTRAAIRPTRGGYPPQSPEQRPPAGYGPPPQGGGYDQGGYRQAPGGYPPPGGQPGYGGEYGGDYGRPPAPPRQEDYGRQEPRPAYPDQGGYPGRAAATRTRATAASRMAARTTPRPTTAATASPRRAAVTPSRGTRSPRAAGTTTVPRAVRRAGATAATDRATIRPAAPPSPCSSTTAAAGPTSCARAPT